MKVVKVVNPENLTDEQRAQLLAAVKEVSNSLARAEGEKDYVREAKKKIAEDLKLPKKLVNKLIKVYHKQSFDADVEEQKQFETLYTKLTTKK